MLSPQRPSRRLAALLVVALAAAVGTAATRPIAEAAVGTPVPKAKDEAIAKAAKAAKAAKKGGAPKKVSRTPEAGLCPVPARFRADAVAAAERYQVPLSLLSAMAYFESRWDPKAVSTAKAAGLMQLMPDTARGLEVDPLDPRQSLMGGAKYLSYLLDRFDGSWPMAVAAYNAGPTIVARVGGAPYAETRHYMRHVIARAEAHKGCV